MKIGYQKLIIVKSKSYFYIFIHENLQLSKKSSNFALFLPNLYLVKLFFMKEDYLKLVYHYYEGKGFFRDFGNSKINIATDFNFLSFFGLSYDRIKRVYTMCTKINFIYDERYPGVAWIDKHGNLIVRIKNFFINSYIHF